MSTEPINIGDQPWFRHADLRRTFAALGTHGKKVRVVGGAVRNCLRAIPVTDVDLATVYKPHEVMARARQYGLKPVATGIEHGTVTLKGATQTYQVTTLRQDIKTDGRHAQVRFGADWEQDARRRDFTMNAIYAAADASLFDPTGGIADARAGRVRFIGDGEQRIREDALRALRFFRFYAQFGRGDIDEAGLRACERQAGLIDVLSAERIGGEIRKTVMAENAVAGLQAMQISGIAARIFPTRLDPERLQRLIRWQERTNTRRCPNPFALRLGALAVHRAGDVSALKTRLALTNDDEHYLHFGLQIRDMAAPQTRQQARRALYRLGSERYVFFLLSTWALAAGEARQTNRAALLALADEVPPRFPLRGEDLMALGYRQGNALGRCLRRLEQRWIDSDFSLGREALLAQARAAIPSTDLQ